jgi:hypothetical protein
VIDFPELRYARILAGADMKRPHAHALFATSERLRDRSLRTFAARAGFATNRDIQAVGDLHEDHLGVATYVTMELVRVAVTLGITRPITFSRNAFPKAPQTGRGDELSQPGSWLRVRIDPDHPESVAPAIERALVADRWMREHKTARRAAALDLLAEAGVDDAA